MSNTKITTETELLKQLPQNLRALRTNAGLTQKQVADFLHTSRSTYTYYEMGITLPKITSLYLLSQFYGVPCDRFFIPKTPSQPEKSSKAAQPSPKTPS